MKKFLAISAISTMLIAESIQMPPMPPSFGAKVDKVKKKDAKMPSSCEMMPPMVLFLPPPMEAELSKCKNELNKPKKEFVEAQLSKLFKKSVKVKTIESVEKFEQLYKVTYDGGVVLVNKTVDAFIEQ